MLIIPRTSHTMAQPMRTRRTRVGEAASLIARPTYTSGFMPGPRIHRAVLHEPGRQNSRATIGTCRKASRRGQLGLRGRCCARRERSPGLQGAPTVCRHLVYGRRFGAGDEGGAS